MRTPSVPPPAGGEQCPSPPPRRQVILTPAPGPRLYLRDHSEGRLERFALLATAPTRDEEYGNRVATIHKSFSAVPLADDPPDGAPGPGPAAALPAVGPGPATAPDAASMDPGPLTVFAVQWPTTRQPYAVAQPPFQGNGHPHGHCLPSPAQAPAGSARGGRRPRPVTVPARAPRPPTRLHMCTRDICLGIAGIMIDVQHRVPAQSASSEIGQANDPGIVTPGRDRSARGRSGARGAGR